MRMRIDKEVGRLRYEYAKTWIDEEKYYKRLSLTKNMQLGTIQHAEGT